MLTRLKWRFESAANGKECFDLYTKDPDTFALILMDCQVRFLRAALDLPNRLSRCPCGTA
jgi:hypothetical protein